jgi:hypothetical protein
MAYGNTTLQLAADPSMRGRGMALWTVAFLGTTPISGRAAEALSRADYDAERAGPAWSHSRRGVHIDMVVVGDKTAVLIVDVQV